MKDNHFIELVNLYIDRQISGQEMESLEAEMQANPRRRAIYRQYCQMHRATTLVYESFRSEDGALSTDKLKTQAKIARFESRDGRRKHWSYYATGLAAACVAIVFAKVTISRNTATQTQTVAVKTAAVQPLAVAQSLPVSSQPVVAVVQQPKPVAVTAPSTSLVANQDYTAMLTAMRKEDQRAFASGQIQPSRTTSLFEDGVFDSQSSGSLRNFRSTPATSQQAEFAAFQFQR
ncbi:MAG TPA: hypothetical protein VGM64_19735 [Lacunisphaera sp.]|jgi:hypothetical protein